MDIIPVVSNVFSLFLVHVMVVMITSTAIYGNHIFFSRKGIGRIFFVFGLIMDSSQTFLIYDSSSSAIIRCLKWIHLLIVTKPKSRMILHKGDDSWMLTQPDFWFSVGVF